MTNLELAAKLKILATIYEANPDIPQLYDLQEGGVAHLFCMTPEEFADTIRAFGPGRKAESIDGNGLEYYPDCMAGTGLRLYAFKDRCCRRVQVGTKRIEAREEQRIERIIPATPAIDVLVFEWRCSPFLAGGEASA